ncbi:unnamed protein product [Auanema sp. JU1783]|nr:unnamed protein product [Auanema sp. JU1783]
MSCFLRRNLLARLFQSSYKCERGLLAARCYSSNETDSEYEDVAAFMKLLRRTRYFNDNYLKPEYRSFTVSRNSELKIDQKDIMVGGRNKNPVYTGGNDNSKPLSKEIAFMKWMFMRHIALKPFVAELPSIKELSQGSRMLFKKILNATITNRIDELAPSTLGGVSVLKDLKSSARSLTEIQRRALRLVSDDDIVGHDGLMLNYCGYSMHPDSISRYIHSFDIVSNDAVGKKEDGKYLCYSVQLLAVGKKKQLYKLVRLLPYKHDRDQMLVSLPKDYGFTQPRYTLMKIYFCHKINENGFMVSLDEDCMLYDFHIFNF